MSTPVSSPDSSHFQDAIREQARASDPAHPAWVSANAGSGKTKVLIDRVARLLLKGAKPDSILCITYTKAAANEMLQRLFSRLGSWSVMDKNTLSRELGALERRGDNPYSDEEIRNARALFAQALETPGGLRIETIHAFCTRVLKRFPLEAGLAPGFVQTDDIEADEIWNIAEATGLIEANENSADILDEVSQFGGGHGAMASMSVARQNATLLLNFADQHGHNPERIDKALRRALNPPDTSEEALIAEAMDALPKDDLTYALTVFEADTTSGSKNATKIIRAVLAAPTPAEKWALYRPLFFTGTDTFRKKIANNGPLKDEKVTELFLTNTAPEGSEVLRIKALDRDLKLLRLYARTRAFLLLTIPILQLYRHGKTKTAAVDYDDLIVLTQKLLSTQAATDWVLYKLDGGLSHVLLDEAQDTSPAQWDLIQSLTREFISGTGIERAQDPRTLFVVGDEKQSIYSFQGADPEEFLAKKQAFVRDTTASLGTAVLPEMQMSFRSSPEILSFVDEVSKSGDVSDGAYISGPLADLNISNHTARRANQPGTVELWPVEVPDQQAEPLASDAPRDTEPASSPKNTVALRTAEEVSRIIERGDMVWEENADRTWELRPARPGDFLILVEKRTGGLFDAIINALKSKHIPVAGADRLVLADHIGVQDCLNLIRFVLLPGDDLTLAEILRGPFGGLLDDNEHLFKLAHERGDVSLWDRLQASKHPEHAKVTTFLANLLEQKHLPAYEFLSHVLNSPFGEEKKTGWERLADRLGGPMRDPVQAMLNRAISFDAKSAASLQGFIARMDLDRSDIKRDLAAPGNEVRVMTIHGAKGLQAPIVILPDTTGAPKKASADLFVLDGMPVWPGAKAEDTEATELAREAASKRSIREHRRLLYVALTRAQDRLIIFGAWYKDQIKTEEDRVKKNGFEKSSWYALCSEAMHSLLGDAFPMAESGRPDFARLGNEPATHAASSSTARQAHAAPNWLFKPAPQETASSRIASPTGLLSDKSSILPPLDQNRADRLKRGRLIHALLERLPALPTDTRETAGHAFLNRDRTLSEDQKKEMLGAAMGVLTDERFDAVFAENGRPEAPIIGQSPELPPGLIINGVVDRLVVTDTDVLIVDFKTDRPPPERPEDVGPAYLTQMAAYAAVIKEAYPGRQVRCALVWTDGPKLMELPAHLLANAISRLSPTV